MDRNDNTERIKTLGKAAVAIASAAAVAAVILIGVLLVNYMSGLVVEPALSDELAEWKRKYEKGGTGYGARSIRTKDFLYIRNYVPDAWPAGEPPLYGDVDAHMLHYPSPTKLHILKNKDRDGGKNLFSLAFAKRPAEELYDLTKDPYQMINIADDAEYSDISKMLSDKLTKYLQENGDPRELGGEMKWLGAPYYAEKDFNPRPSEEARQALNLKEEYSYID